MHNFLTVDKIRTQKDFFYIKKKGNKIVYRPFIILFTTNDDCNTIKVGYIVSSRVGNAVIRNKVKRRLKNITKNVFKEINISNSNGLSICIIARTSAYNYNFDKMKDLLINAIKKITN